MSSDDGRQKTEDGICRGAAAPVVCPLSSVLCPLVVTRSHLDEIEPRYCARGARRWAARLGLDWTEFVQHGIPVEKLEQTGDAMALKLAEFVRSRRECGDLAQFDGIHTDRSQHGV